MKKLVVIVRGISRSDVPETHKTFRAVAGLVEPTKSHKHVNVCKRLRVCQECTSIQVIGIHCPMYNKQIPANISSQCLMAQGASPAWKILSSLQCASTLAGLQNHS